MPEIPQQMMQQYVNALRDFTFALNSSSFGAGGNARRASRAGTGGDPVQTTASKGENRRLEKALQDSSETFKQFTKMQKHSVDALSRDLADYSKLSGRMFEDAVTKLDVKGLDKLTEATQSQLDSLGSSLSKEIRTIDQLVRTQERMGALAQRIGTQEYKLAREKFNVWRKEGHTTEQLEEELEKLHLTTSDLDKSFEELEREVKDFHTAIGNAARTTNKDYAGGLTSVTQKLLAFASVMGSTLVALEAGVKPIRDAAKMGVDMNPQQLIDATFKLGMSFEELSGLQGQYRTSIVSLGLDMDKYNDVLSNNMQFLTMSTASMKDAAMISADLAEQHRLLGGSVSSLGNYMEDQSKAFERMNKTISMTGEEFVELNKHLRTDTAIRGQMIRMTKERRTQYFQETQQLYERLRLGGMTNDQAKQLISTLAELGGGGAKGRIQQAAKLQSVMGAAGMGAQGQRAGALLRGGLRNKGDKDEFKKIMTEANNVIGQKMGQSLGSELAFGQMIEKTGLEKLLGPGSMFQDSVIQQGLAIEEGNRQDAANAAALQKWQVGMKSTTDIISATLKNEVAQTLGSILMVTTAIASMGGVSGLGGLGGVGRIGAGLGATAAGSAAIGITAAVAAGVVSGYAEYNKNKERTDLTDTQKTAKIVARGSGTAMMAGLGSAIGGLVGTLGGPLGTAAGIAAGGAIGGYLGDMGYGAGLSEAAEYSTRSDAERYAELKQQQNSVADSMSRIQESLKRAREGDVEMTQKHYEHQLEQWQEFSDEMKMLNRKVAEIPEEAKKTTDAVKTADQNEETRQEKNRREFNKVGARDVLIRRTPARAG